MFPAFSSLSATPESSSAANNDGVWNETGAAVEFYLAPRFYHTYWFYALCLALLALTGWLAGRFGVKYIFLASVIGFTLASALCGAATSLTQLVLYRLLQGVCSAGLVPLGQAT